MSTRFLLMDQKIWKIPSTRGATCLVVAGTGNGNAVSVLHSHWTRNVEAWLSLVERTIVLLRQLPHAIKNQLVASKVGEFGCDELVLYDMRYET